MPVTALASYCLEASSAMIAESKSSNFAPRLLPVAQYTVSGEDSQGDVGGKLLSFGMGRCDCHSSVSDGVVCAGGLSQ